MKRQTTRKVLTELNSTYEKKFGCSFTECIPSDCPEEGLERKRTCNEKRKERRKVIRQCKNHLEHQYHEQDATTVLEEGLSHRKYHNLRLAQSFETPPQTQKRSRRSNPTRKSHSPNFSKAAWDKAGLVEEAKTLGTQKVNWKALGEKHGITGGNAGQIAKEFLQSQGIDTSTMDQHSGGMRLRARKLRMPGGEISVPCHSTPKHVKEDWVKMIEDGIYSLGEQCSPKQLTIVRAERGHVITKEVTVHSRKIPLAEIREKLLRKHERWMRLMTDEQILKMTTEEALQFLDQIHLPTQQIAREDLHSTVKKCQRTRTLGLWHDHDTLFGHGYIMVTIQVYYDPAVFLSNDEANLPPGKDLQTIVELPEVHMLAICGDSHAEQAALVPDRVSCLSDLNQTLTSNNGCEIKDVLRFFSGDHPAQSVEKGCQ